MRFWINEQGLKKTLFFVPDTKLEATRLDDFARAGEPLKGKIVNNRDYIYNFVELVKET